MQCNRCGSAFTGSPKFCPTCGSPVALEEKEIASVATGERLKVGRIARVTFPVVLVVGLAAFFWYINPSTHKIIRAQPVVTEPFEYDTMGISMSPVAVRDAGDAVAFSLEDVKKNKIVRFEYNTGTTIRPVLAYIARDGRLVTAISVSEKCTSTEFKLKGKMIHCANCASRWDMLTMEAFSCCPQYYPDPIPSTVQDGDVLIKKSTIERWAGRM